MIIALLAVTMLVVWGAYPDDVSQLRAGGQLAVDELHAQWTAASAADRAQFQKTLDRVCAQKDCHASRLYWYTDLDGAKEAAQRLGRPILSLHLLGRLDEELSCANSRFFRTLLYSDESISSILRDQYVLHWHSVREVPRVTIELGGGRVIRQTLTGNSAHYLLRADGVPLDVLPGLYSPDAFRDHLERWVTLYRQAAQGGDEALRRYHEEGLAATTLRAMELGIDPSLDLGEQLVWAAQRRSQSKMATEAPVLRRLRPDLQARGKTPAATRRERDPWRLVGEQGKDGIRFSESTMQLMRSKQPLSEKLLDNLRRTVAADTAFNESDLHRRVHEWFVRGEVSDLHSLNERVYDELFLTPSSDPWLGLMPDSVFTGIEESVAIEAPVPSLLHPEAIVTATAGM